MSAVTGISGIQLSAASAAYAPTNSADVSAIASSYAESAASSKLDTTAYNSSDFYTTANPSGFIDSAYVDSAVSGKADSSAMSSYVPYSSLEYNTASAISGINGSALAAGSTYSAGEGIDITDDVISVEAPVDIVAGPGIVIDNPDGNTLRVSTDENYETVLWSGTAAISNFPITLSEVPANFERIRINFKSWTDNPTFNEFPGSANLYNLNSNWSDGSGISFYFNERLTLNGTTLSFIAGKFCAFGDNVVNNQTSNFTVYKIVGIHRIANN